MILVAGGDSFVYGHELSDSYPYRDDYSKKTFPALLAKNINLDYDCTAYAGYSNASIARRVMTRCSQINEKKIVFVLWTFPSRYEFRFSYSTEQKHSPWYAFNSWILDKEINNLNIQTSNKEIADIIEHNIRAEKTGIQQFAKVFYEHVGNEEYWEIYSSLKEIVFLQNYLKCQKIPYMFSCADNILFYNYTLNTNDEFVSALYNQIDFDQFYFFPSGTGYSETKNPRGFYQWALENKFPVGSLHPLEAAHSAAAEIIKETFNELVKKSLE